jgi:nitrogenase subunit NifH
LAEAPSYGKTIFEYEPKCHGAADYQTVAEYIHSQTGTEAKGDISKQPPIPIQEIAPVNKAASIETDEVVETSQTDTNSSSTSD